jgi:hypothetical protein
LVTNLNDSGAGSLRTCIEASGPRTCIFRVGGTIKLQKTLIIRNPYITIAGQTAPGGVALTTSGAGIDNAIGIATHNVVIRFLRIRDAETKGYSNCVGMHANNVVLDHLSLSWGEWDNLSIYQTTSTDIRNATLQWSLLAEPVTVVNGGVNIAVSGATPALADKITDLDYHHNLLSSTSHRNPLDAGKSGRIVNNIVYNWTYYATRVKGYKDIIGNYFKAGSYTGGKAPSQEIQAWNNNNGNDTTFLPSLFVVGNAGPHNGFNPNVDNWSTLTALSVDESRGQASAPLSSSYRRSSRMCSLGESSGCVKIGSPGLPITIHSAADLAAPNGVLLPPITSSGKPGVGASAYLDCTGRWVSNRDSLDERYVREFVNGTGGSAPVRLPGVPPALPARAACADSNSNGIPDAYEIAKCGTASCVKATSIQADGYTALEHYLNGQ